MQQVQQQVQRIQQKLQQLLKQHALLQKDNQRLQALLRETEELNRQQQETIEKLKLQADVLRINAGEMGATDKKEFEKRINLYLKEIDRCIALLGE